ncbi:MAG: hypothetical protein K2Y39_14740 [Candidatus Obscuribacterales bacterium]|nr:hypothetical protein [Candidatus Obscuribacterales bacterium]
MKNEEVFLTIFIGAFVSAAVCISLFWTSPVTIALAGVTVFCLIVKTGWSLAGTSNVEGLGIFSLAGLWLLLALLVWFFLLDPLTWSVILASFAALTFLWLRLEGACKKQPAKSQEKGENSHLCS